MKKEVERNMRLLQLLSQSFPTEAAAGTEIINLEAILNLPKPTEHFVADIHGEYEAFLHILRNASGNIRRKVIELFGSQMRDKEIRELCTLIYYPEQKLELIKEREKNINDYYIVTLNQLVKVCRVVCSKYTRSKVRKVLPKEFAYIIEELLHEDSTDNNKQAYFNAIFQSIVDTRQSDDLIIALCHVIQRLAIDRLHILGDIYDRGPGSHIILDFLSTYHNFDIQWGNHDALWMGAAAGNLPCIANVIRLSLRYGNIATLEDGYGINLMSLATFAMEVYAKDPCKVFFPKTTSDNTIYTDKTLKLHAKMHKAITVIQFKLEMQMTNKHPEWNIDRTGTLEHIDFKKGLYVLNGRQYEMTDISFPTIDEKDPYKLTADEKELIQKIKHSFCVSEKLQKHIKLLFSNGSMYGIYNSNLLFHASIPLNADGSLKKVKLTTGSYCGKQLLQHIALLMRSAFNVDTPKKQKQNACDYFWYLWCGPDSPLFDKSRMSTFERYFLTDKELQHEEKGYYYKMREDATVCDNILDSFDVHGKNRHIINGHVPVHASEGENPIKASGKLMVIDGGFAKSYHDTTGIAGYTLVFHSRGFQLIQHEPFESISEAVKNETDIKSSTQIVQLTGDRIMVRDTDKGEEVQKQIKELKELLYAYRHGYINEKKV